MDISIRDISIRCQECGHSVRLNPTLERDLLQKDHVQRWIVEQMWHSMLAEGQLDRGVWLSCLRRGLSALRCGECGSRRVMLVLNRQSKLQII